MSLMPACLFLAFSSLLVEAQSRTSSNYTLLQETTVSGGYGERSSSTNYSLDDAGGEQSIATSNNYSHRDGFVGQLRDAVNLELNASPNSVDEESISQITANLRFDDDTLELGVTPLFSFTSAALASIDSDGLVKTSVIAEDTTSSVAADYFGTTGSLNLTVIDSDPDNFLSYGSDGLPDSWQVNFFGSPPNNAAAPEADSDGDSQSNQLEYLTGYNPTNSQEFFCLEITSKSSTEAALTASKMIPGTIYRLQRSLDLGQADPWNTVNSYQVSSEQNDASLLDNSPPDPNAFYRVLVVPE